MTRNRAAVLGSPVAHSLSPVLHTAAYAVLGIDWTYGRYQVEEDELAGFVAGLDDTWAGLSLTMPLKRAAIPLCTELSDTARIVGGANTLVLGPEGSCSGDNTDVPGLVNALAEAGVERVSAATIIGGGATAASAVAALAEICEGPVQAYVRSVDRAAALPALAEVLGVELRLRLWDEIEDGLAAPLVLATTPGGSTDAMADRVPAGPGVLFDVAYHPWPTVLAQGWEKAGGQVVSGLELLIHQAVLQVELMTRQKVPRAEIVAAMRTAGRAALAERSGEH